MHILNTYTITTVLGLAEEGAAITHKYWIQYGGL